MFPWTSPPTSWPTPPPSSSASATWPPQPPTASLPPDHLWHGQHHRQLPQQFFLLDIVWTHSNIHWAQPICLGLHLLLWNICLDTRPRYTLRGPRRLQHHQLPIPHHHRHLLHLHLHIRCQLNILFLLQFQQQAPVQRLFLLLHLHLWLPPDQLFRQHGQLLLLQFTNHQYHMHHYRIHLFHHKPTTRQVWVPLQQHLPHPLLDKQQSKQLRRSVPTRRQRNRAVRLHRHLLLRLLRLHRTHLRYNKTWQHWALPPSNLLNPSAFYNSNNINCFWTHNVFTTSRISNYSDKTHHHQPHLQCHLPPPPHHHRHLLQWKPDQSNLLFLPTPWPSNVMLDTD